MINNKQIPDNSRCIRGPSLLERFIALRSKDQREWFRLWLEVQGYAPIDEDALDELVRRNKRTTILGLILMAVVTSALIAVFGTLHDWW